MTGIRIGYELNYEKREGREKYHTDGDDEVMSTRGEEKEGRRKGRRGEKKQQAKAWCECNKRLFGLELCQEKDDVKARKKSPPPPPAQTIVQRADCAWLLGETLGPVQQGPAR